MSAHVIISTVKENTFYPFGGGLPFAKLARWSTKEGRHLLPSAETLGRSKSVGNAFHGMKEEEVFVKGDQIIPSRDGNRLG